MQGLEILVLQAWMSAPGQMVGQTIAFVMKGGMQNLPDIHKKAPGKRESDS